MPGRSLLDAAHVGRQRALQNAVAASLRVLLAGMPDLDEPALAEYVDGAYPLVAGGQREAADTAAGYIGALAVGRARALEQPYRPARVLDVFGALTKSGVLVQPDSRSLVAPVLRARAVVAEGELEAVALEQASSYAAGLSSNDLQAAQRVGLGEGSTASGLHPSGWAKTPAGSACKWCRSIADNVYRHPDEVPFHDHDRCGVGPALDDSDLEYDFTDADIPF